MKGAEVLLIQPLLTDSLCLWSYCAASVVFTNSLNEQTVCASCCGIQLGHTSDLIYPLTARVAGAPKMISQPVFSIFPCSPLPSGTWWTPGLSIPWCCLPTSSSVCLVFFPLSLCLARWFWLDLTNGRHDHNTAVCVSLQWSRGLRVVRLPAGSWHELPR